MTTRGRQSITIIVAIVVTVATWFLTNDEEKLLFAILNQSLPYSSDFAHTTTTATVVRVIDGDTIELADGEKVRYIGIDAPELGSGSAPDCYATTSTAVNQDLVLGHNVHLVPDRSDRDRYGRLLRYVYVDDLFVNQELVARGAARARAYPHDTRWRDVLAATAATAQAAQVGLWSACPE